MDNILLIGIHPFPRSNESIRAIALLRGSQSGYKYAEAFMSLLQCYRLMKSIINFKKTIKQAIIKMNSIGRKCLVILDDNSNYLGNPATMR